MSTCNNDRESSPQQEAESVLASLQRIKNKILVMSGKGGVGKTSVSVNLALALAKNGFQVGIMDVDIHGPDVPRMLGLKGMLGSGADRIIRQNHSVIAADAL